MKEPRNHLPRDLKALRYLDALNAGDLEAVAALWEEATHDPELERMLAELDGAMFREIPGNPSGVAPRTARAADGATGPSGALRIGTPERPPACWPFSPGPARHRNQGANPPIRPSRYRGRTPTVGRLTRPHPVTQCATRPGRGGNAAIRLAAWRIALSASTPRSARLSSIPAEPRERETDLL